MTIRDCWQLIAAPASKYILTIITSYLVIWNFFQIIALGHKYFCNQDNVILCFIELQFLPIWGKLSHFQLLTHNIIMLHLGKLYPQGFVETVVSCEETQRWGNVCILHFTYLVNTSLFNKIIFSQRCLTLSIKHFPVFLCPCQINWWILRNSINANNHAGSFPKLYGLSYCQFE